MEVDVDSDILEICNTLVKNYKGRNTLFNGMDDVFYGNWDLPDGMPKWVQKTIATDGHDAVQTATRVMSQSRNMRIKVLPMLNDDPNRQRANDLATALKWNILSANRRGDGSVLWDIAFSAVQYAMPVTEVVYLPYQKKILEKLKKPTDRIDRARKYGDFAFINHHPANVYPVYTMYGIDGVMIVKCQTAAEFIREWGGKFLNKSKEGAETYVHTYDFRNYDRRYIWGVESHATNIDELTSVEDGFEMMDEENEAGFIPIAIDRWGNSLSSSIEDRYMPLLRSVYESGQWDMLNVFASLDTTLAWKRAARPEFIHESPSGENAEYDYTEPIGEVKAPPGSKISALPPQSIDPRVASMYSNIRGQVWQSTVARALQSLDFPAGTAYSSINQVLSAATASLAPYKTLGEHNISKICDTMLCWIKYFGKEYGGARLYGEYENSKAGDTVNIPFDEINPEAVRIEAVLTPDVPLDEQEKANTAVLIKREFNIPQEDLLEGIGFTDTDDLAERRALEDVSRSHVDLSIERMARELEFEYQSKMAQLQNQMQQQQQEAMMQQQEELMRQQQANQPITEPAGGLGMNPAAGGGPSVQAVPGQGEV